MPLAKVTKRIGIFVPDTMFDLRYIKHKTLAVVVAAFLICGGWFVHKFYVSLTEIRYNAESSTFEISMRIFPDDMDRVLNKIHGISTHLATELEPRGTDSLVRVYLEEHFSIESDGRPILLSYMGKEPEADAIWCYLESEQVDNPSAIVVHNSILMEEFEDQVNIIQVYAGKWNRGMLLTREHSTDQLKIGE